MTPMPSDRPFVGPAGQLLDRAMEEAGLARDEVYLTNAVKHFKFEPRGKRRIHQTPTTGEVDHCRWWLIRERELIRPRREQDAVVTGQRIGLHHRRAEPHAGEERQVRRDIEVERVGQFLDGGGADVGLHGQMMDAVAARQLERRLQLLDRAREALALDREAMILCCPDPACDLGGVVEVMADAVEARRLDQAEAFGERPLGAAGLAMLHAPDRLQDVKLRHGGGSLGRRYSRN